VIAWLATMVSVAVTWVTATAFLVSLARDWNQPGRLATACFAALRRLLDSDSGPVPQAGLVLLVGGGASALGFLGWRLARSLRRAVAQGRGNAERARVTGRRIAGVDAVVLDGPERAADCVAGRPDTIVVASAALDALTDRPLQAVFVHERAHLAGHHHFLLAFARALAIAIPGAALFSPGAREIARLLAMAADDAAARGHGSKTPLNALLALSLDARAPLGAVAATGNDVLARAERLAAPIATRINGKAGCCSLPQHFSSLGDR
jgi:Zn-dependent protease with chaperone function